MTGSSLIEQERLRQIFYLGRSTTDDVVYNSKSELLDAALAYAERVRSLELRPHVGKRQVPAYWPWGPLAWHPTTPLRMLVKAGALIAAEIDRRLAIGEEL